MRWGFLIRPKQFDGTKKKSLGLPYHHNLRESIVKILISFSPYLTLIFRQ